jgi:hypothetical protein
MKHTPEQEICATNETDVYKPRETCKTCPIASRCAVKQYPPCNMKRRYKCWHYAKGQQMA